MCLRCARRDTQNFIQWRHKVHIYLKYPKNKFAIIWFFSWLIFSRNKIKSDFISILTFLRNLSLIRKIKKPKKMLTEMLDIELVEVFSRSVIWLNSRLFYFIEVVIILYLSRESLEALGGQIITKKRTSLEVFVIGPLNHLTKVTLYRSISSGYRWQVLTIYKDLTT